MNARETLAALSVIQAVEAELEGRGLSACEGCSETRACRLMRDVYGNEVSLCSPCSWDHAD